MASSVQLRKCKLHHQGTSERSKAEGEYRYQNAQLSYVWHQPRVPKTSVISWILEELVGHTSIAIWKVENISISQQVQVIIPAYTISKNSPNENPTGQAISKASNWLCYCIFL